MKKIALILCSGINIRLKEICFDRPQCLLSVCGQTLIRRFINQFWDYVDKFYLASGNNTPKIRQEFPVIDKIHFLDFDGKQMHGSGEALQQSLIEIKNLENSEYSLVILEGDLVISDLAINRFIENKSPLKFMCVDKKINDHDDAIVRTNQGFRFTKERNDNWLMLGKFIGVTEISFAIANSMLVDKYVPEQYAEWITNYTSHMFDPILAKHEEAMEIDTPEDYSSVLHNYNIKPTKDIFDSYVLHFNQGLQSFIGVYDVIGAKVARQMGLSGLYLGSYQISSAYGKKDNADFSIKESFNTARNIRYAGIEMPMIMDGMSGYQNLDELKQISKEVYDLKIGGFCVDDLSDSHKCSMNVDFDPSLLSLDRYKNKIDTLREYLPSTCKIIARTELLNITDDLSTIRHRLLEIDSMGADILLPHYVKQNIHFLEEVLNGISFKTPLMIIPSRLLDIDKRYWKNLGYEYVIYANADLRLRIEKLEQLYEELTIHNSISAEMLEPNALTYMYDFG